MLSRSKNGISIVIVLGMVVIVMFANSCYRKGENIPTGPPTANSRLTDGWQAFESGEYEEAIASFAASKNRDAAYYDAYNGLAWSYTRIFDYDQAMPNFKVYMTLVSDKPELLIDAYAGLATMYAASGDDQEAINWANQIIDTNPAYQFNHDARINAKSLVSLIAKSYYNLEDYLAALKIVQSSINSDFVNTLKSDGILFDAVDDTIQIRVRAVSQTPMSGQVVMEITRMLDDTEIDVSLVDVISVTSARTQSRYDILSFAPGNNLVRIYGNPIPRDKDKFLVNYLYTTDFVLFISRLLKEIENNQ